MTKKIFLSNHINSLKAQTKYMSLEQLESIYKKLELIVLERREQEKEAKENLAEYNQKIETYLKQIKNDGIEVIQLLKKGDPPAFKKLRKQRPPRPPKYKYFDAEGRLRTWTGQGRMPKPIKTALTHSPNKSLDDFLI